MKRISVLVLLFALLAAGPGGAPGSLGALRAAAQSGADPASPLAGWPLFIPLLGRLYPTFSITGQVIDSDGQPLSGVTVTADNGASATTDSQGYYDLAGLTAGSYAIAPALPGYSFEPAVISVGVPAEAEGRNFTALESAAELIVNGGFEVNAGWEFPITEYPAGYFSAWAHSGLRMARTGIIDQYDNVYSYSSIRQAVTIPAGTTSAILRMWLYTISLEDPNQPAPAIPLAATSEELESAPLAVDVQYALILDANNDILEWLYWQRNNNKFWTLHEFNLTKYAGRTIKVHIGTYNDGYGGITSMFVDDVSLETSALPAATPTPTPTATPTVAPPGVVCNNAFVNSSFETNAGWGIPATEFTAGYSYERAHSGVRSMRTGIVHTAQNKYSYSDAYQYAAIPNNITSAVLSMWIYPLSEEAANAPLPAAPAIGEEFGKTPLASDVQYVLVLEPYNNRIIDVLLWVRSDAQTWLNLVFDLSAYAGRTIRIQFGTYNDGWNGVTTMFVDDAAVDYCTAAAATPTPTLPAPPTATPIGGCVELIGNGGFEGSGSWVIPATAFSAGYSYDRAYAGLRSMRTGITASAHNRYSYSDFRQTVAIPSWARSAVFSFWEYPSSGESANVPVPAIPEGEVFALEPMAGDVQYLLILNSWLNWIDTLVWQRSDARAWVYHAYDLVALGYRSDTISLQFGTYNNGWGGVTSMYVDNASLLACP